MLSMVVTLIVFLSTLSLRRATSSGFAWLASRPYFYPRSPCGERLMYGMILLIIFLFLSTLSLRRATTALAVLLMFNLYFYPRSPCGERRVHYDNYNLHCVISIHALLAESDTMPSVRHLNQTRFLSTLSLRRATDLLTDDVATCGFLSTLSLRRATLSRVS